MVAPAPIPIKAMRKSDSPVINNHRSPVKQSLLIEDRVSFRRKNASLEEVWALSRKKLESRRVLVPTAVPGMLPGAQPVNSNLSVSVSSFGSLSSMRNYRRSSFMVPRKARFSLLLPHEVVVLKRTLSDPHLRPEQVQADDEAGLLSSWMSDATDLTWRPARQRRRSIFEIPTPSSARLAKALLHQLAAELNMRVPPAERLREAFARRDLRIRQEFEAARQNPLHHLESVADVGSTARSRALTQRQGVRKMLAEAGAAAPAPVAPLHMTKSMSSSTLISVRKSVSANSTLPHVKAKSSTTTVIPPPVVSAPAIVANSSGPPPGKQLDRGASALSLTHATGPAKKQLMTRKDCVLEYDGGQERYVLKFATCDRMVTSLVDRFVEVEKEEFLFESLGDAGGANGANGGSGATGATGGATAKKGDRQRFKRQRLAEVTSSARNFCIGSLKLWSATEVLWAMQRLSEEIARHADKMQGTDWAVTSDMGCLEQLVRVWLQACFPHCVKDSDTLQVFTSLIAAMPNREQLDEDIVHLSQAARPGAFSRGNGTGSVKSAKKQTLNLFGGSSEAARLAQQRAERDFMHLDILTVPASEFAQELTRLTLFLMRRVAVDKLVNRDLTVDKETARAARSALELAPLFVLRSRTERLSHWTASVVVGEKSLKRRTELFSKMVSIAVRLVELRNMHDAVAMVTALHNPAVSRLRQTLLARRSHPPLPA